MVSHWKKSCMLFVPHCMDMGLELLQMFRWGLVLENTPVPSLLLCSLSCSEDALIQLDELSVFSGWVCFVFYLNFCYFRSNILDNQLSHVQGWKDFPAAEAVTGTLGNVPKCLTDSFPYCSSKHWHQWGRQGTAGMWQLPVIMLLNEGVEGGCYKPWIAPAA